MAAKKTATDTTPAHTAPEDGGGVLSAGQAAEAIGTTGARLRVFLRASDDWTAVGAGRRYSFTESDIPKLKKGFHEFTTKEDAKKAAKKQAAETATATN